MKKGKFFPPPAIFCNPHYAKDPDAAIIQKEDNTCVNCGRPAKFYHCEACYSQHRRKNIQDAKVLFGR